MSFYFLTLGFCALMVGGCRGVDVVSRSLEEVDHPLVHYQDLFVRDEEEHVQLDLKEGKIPTSLSSARVERSGSGGEKWFE